MTLDRLAGIAAGAGPAIQQVAPFGRDEEVTARGLD
jgi:hypothetical protein